MKKRTFLKKGGTLVLGGSLLAFCSRSGNKEGESVLTNNNTSSIPASSHKNWAGNLEYSAKEFYQPESVEELQELIRAADKIRPLGTRHCFNTIADSKHSQVSVRSFDNMITIDSNAGTATIDAGASYGQICTDLYKRGYALHNLASLPHISVAGAMATATHGSGVKNGNLGSAVSAFTFIDAQGEIQRLSRKDDGEIFDGMVTHLGGLGVIIDITLDLETAFDAVQQVYQFLPVSNLLENFSRIMSSGYSVSLFTDYQTETVNQVWVKSKVGQQEPAVADFFGAKAATKDLHPIVTLSAENCTSQMGVPGPWYERLPHFKMEFTPSSGKELQSEFFVPMDKAAAAFEVISALKDHLKKVLMISEVRAIAADKQWMSPFYQQDSIAFHFTWEQDRQGVAQVLPLIQEGLKPFGVRPHWGKVFTIDPQLLQSLYPNRNNFLEVLARYDPNGKFRNDFIQKYLY